MSDYSYNNQKEKSRHVNGQPQVSVELEGVRTRSLDLIEEKPFKGS